MGLDTLLNRIEIVTPITAVTFSDVTPEPLLHKAATPVTCVTPEIIVMATEAKKDTVQDVEVIAAPLFSGSDRRLTIQTAETQYMGHECGSCVNMDMQAHIVPQGGRRRFQWTCKAGYRPLCAGCGLERVLVAPPECDRYESHTRPAG